MLLLQSVVTTVLCVDVHAYADADDDASPFEDMPVDPNSPLQPQHFCPETPRIYYRALSSKDLPDLQHVSPLLLVSAFIICPYLPTLQRIRKSDYKAYLFGTEILQKTDWDWSSEEEARAVKYADLS